MPSPMRISRDGLNLLKLFEGFRPRATALPNGGWLIGHGHRQYARKGMVVTEAQAEMLLRHDLIPIIAELHTRIYAPVSQGQFDALAMFAFNVGIENFRRSGVCAHLNAGETLAAAEKMSAWRSATIDGNTFVVDALVRRRAAEKAWFLQTPFEVLPASTGLVVPAPDIGAGAWTALPVNQGFERDQAANEHTRGASSMPSAAPRPTSTSTSTDAVPTDRTPPRPPAEVPEPVASATASVASGSMPTRPSPLRARYHDLLKSRRSADQSGDVSASSEATPSVADQRDGGSIFAFCMGALFLGGATYGGIVSTLALKSGGAPSVVALACLFGGGAGACLSFAAALRLMPDPLSAQRVDSQPSKDGAGSTEQV